MKLSNMKLSKYLLILSFILILPATAQGAFGLDENIRQVKTSDSPAVYYLDHIKAIKKAYINGQAFLSYGNKWEDIKIITEAELDKWPEIQVVKLKSSPGVYYLKNGQKTLIKTAKDFASLGFQWSDVVSLNEYDLSQYAEATYERIGLALHKLVDYELVKAKSSSAVYYLKNKLKAPIKSARDFIKLGFKWDDINVVEDEDLSEYSEVSYNEAGLEVPATGQVEIALNSTSPETSRLPLNTDNHILGVFNIKSLGTRAEIYSLNFSLEGIFSLPVINDIYITDESGFDLGITPGSSEKDFIFNFQDNPLIVAPNRIRKIYVVANLSDCSNCTKHSLGVSLKQASSINSDSEIIGNFPVASDLADLIEALDVLGQVNIEEESVSEANLEAIIGEAEQVIGKFKIKETSSQEDIEINSLTFKLEGSVTPSHLSNFRLLDEKKKQIAQTNAISNSRMLSFSLANYFIDKGDDKTFTITADFNNGDGFNFDIKLNSVNIVGKNNGFSLRPSYTPRTEKINIIRRDLGVIALDSKAGKNTFSEKTGTILGVFQIRNSNQNIYLDSFDLKLNNSLGAPTLDKEIYLVDYNTGETLGQLSKEFLNNNQFNFNVPDNTLTAKKTLTIAFITDMPNITQDGHTYQLTLRGVNYRTDNNLFFQDKVEVSGETLEALLSRVSIYPNPNFPEEPYTKGQTKIKVASFYLESSAGDDILINGLSINKGSLSSSLTYANGFSNLKVYIGSKRLATIEQPDKTAYNFDGFSYKLRAGKRIEIKIYADSSKDLKINEADIKITALTASSYSSGIDTAVSGLNVSSNGISFVEAKVQIETIDGGTVSTETDDNILGSFKITNTGGEKIKLNYLTLAASDNGLSYSAGYEKLTLNRIDDNGKIKRVGSSISKPVAGSNRIRMSSYRLEPDEELVFYVYADTTEAINSSFKMYVSRLEASGYSSKTVADVTGTPTTEANVAIVAVVGAE